MAAQHAADVTAHNAVLSEGRDPGGVDVRHETGTGRRAGEAPDDGRGSRHVWPPPTRCMAGATSSGLRSGRHRWPTFHHPLRVAGCPCQRQGDPH